METVLLIVGIALILIGILGSFLPVLPGPPVAYAALFLLLWDEQGKVEIGINDFVLYGIAVIIITLADYYLPVWGTKKFGGTDAGKKGSLWGMILALFVLTPFTGALSIIIGPLVGAYIGEKLAGYNHQQAMRSAWGSFLGFAAGMVLKIAYCGVVLWKFITAAL